MTERRRPYRRGRRPYNKRQPNADPNNEPNPYRDGDGEGVSTEGGAPEGGDTTAPREGRLIADDEGAPPAETAGRGADDGGEGSAVREPQPGNERHPRHEFQRRDDDFGGNRNGRRNRRRHGRRGRDGQPQAPQQPVVADSETLGWFDSSRDGGFIRRAANSYLADAGDAWVPPHIVRQYTLRRGDQMAATTGRDHRGRTIMVDLVQLNGVPVAELARRPDFGSLTATYPERRLTLETGRPAKGGPELTRRAIDLVAPVGYGQRALIVAPARAGKTMLLHAITEGIAINHPNAVLLILLVDERPEEVSEAISWGVGEVIASSFDQPAPRHVEVCEMVLEHARRLVETGKDVVIVLDSLTRMARAHNTAERGSGRTMSGGLDTSAMAKPKAFFGSARAVHPRDGGGSLTIIATALVETGSRMDDVIFEEFKGTGNCEIKLDRSLAEKRIFPAFDIAASGTRREEKLYKEGQLDAIYTLRRGLQQMPPQSAMEWLIKRIAATQNNDALLAGL
jgi:transcription termination factor Rho